MVPLDHDTITSLATLDIDAATATTIVSLPSVYSLTLTAVLVIGWLTTLWLGTRGIAIPGDRTHKKQASTSRHTT